MRPPFPIAPRMKKEERAATDTAGEKGRVASADVKMSSSFPNASGTDSETVEDTKSC